MPEHGTASEVRPGLGEFLATGAKALYFVSGELNKEQLDRWARNSEEMQRVIRLGLGPVIVTAPTAEQTAAGIVVKTVTIQIGGGRTTDTMIEAAVKDCGRGNVSREITQKNMPAGFGPLRHVVLEFRQFDSDPYTEEVCEWIEQSGRGHPTYEDGLRFREARPEDQRQQPHVIVPENPWCDAHGIPFALDLWGNADRRRISLNSCRPRFQWHRDCLFARRKYSVA